MSEAQTMPVAPARQVPRWLWIALTVSLAFNLLLVGLIAGAAAFRARWGGPIAAGAAPFGYIWTLPRERREELRRAAGPGGLAALRPMWQATREARREADRLFLAEPFDAERFLAAHQLMVEKEADARKATSRLLAAAGARMSLEERRQMLSWRERHGRRWRDRGGSDGAPGTPGDAGQRRQP